MTSIDDLFKKSNVLPTHGSVKRKFEAPDPQQAYKAAKLSANGLAHAHNNSASVEDDLNGDEDDMEAGPELPPEGDEGDDDEGRFFGGGVTRSAAQALDYLNDQASEEESFQEEKIDTAWLRRQVVSFEKKAKKNSELRARYESEPQKFMQSEADLDDEIKNWSLLPEHPDLYSEFAESEAVGLLVGLLAHDNTDIAISAVEIMSELTDDDVGVEPEFFSKLVVALLDADLMELLMANLARLDETEEADRSGVYHTLSMLENLAGDQAVAERIGIEKVLEWLGKRVQRQEKIISQNKQYAAEVLQVFMFQPSSTLRRRMAIDVEGVDLFLQLLSAYRKRDPTKDSTEEEYAENLFDALTCLVDDASGKSKFVEAEGVELAFIMLKEGGFSKQRALRLLDHACGGTGAEAVAVCEKVVDAAGLKVIFSMFMKKTDSTATEHLIGIFASLLRLLPGESAARIRTLAKFSEKNYEKVSKLNQLRNEYARKVEAIDKEITLGLSTRSAEEAEEPANAIFSRRLDGGLFCLQTIDVLLAWLCAEDTGARKLIKTDVGSGVIKQSLQDQIDGLDPDAGSADDTGEMLGTLVSFLE
ncbi:DUF1716-domain-containing protein [Teratosphaeria nubilosa]|uniref:DUF1716-domain-containing protein n=1 Tax=Teratosphaeria nubilosa TaxID=161662 RepID=A0A6G1L2J3_9PEZI|nr:DUF1716-domain-containing protein [Teratosphaeria nubilosa]